MRDPKKSVSVLVAGIGGASLGTEIVKALLMAGRYRIYGCDISPYAFGHYMKGLEETFLADPLDYVSSVAQLCQKHSIKYIIPGGEKPLALLSGQRDVLKKAGAVLAANSNQVMSLFANKFKGLSLLKEKGFAMPVMAAPASPEELDEMPMPCVVKPSEGSGGSDAVFLANDLAEARLYVTYLIRNNKSPVVQQFIPDTGGEFTVGVLHLPDGKLAGSVAMRRTFHSKLSVRDRAVAGVISSGYSQGYIGDFPEVRNVAESIAQSAGSTGPLNIQGRLHNGVFYPFEINPRFSATTYLRALAGFNEIDFFIRFLETGRYEAPGRICQGYYLRSLCETFVNSQDIKK
jgi:carbamoyl-phosphate synthase large subunit